MQRNTASKLGALLRRAVQASCEAPIPSGAVSSAVPGAARRLLSTQPFHSELLRGT